jgi:palmitoyltransferase ZDHHC9/14/18
MLYQAMTLIYIIATSALHLYFYHGQEHKSFQETLASPMGIGSAIAFSLSVAVIWPVAALLSYHVRVSSDLCESCRRTPYISFISFSS